jgi:hypothetical protein
LRQLDAEPCFPRTGRTGQHKGVLKRRRQHDGPE